jgi:pimeloyl-ACP methyl ester carboxylesterase
MAPTGTYIEANGLEVYYEHYGEGEPLLLVHGGTATSQSWASLRVGQLGAVARQYGCELLV